LARAPLSDETRRTYASKVRTYLAWLDSADVDGDPLTDPAARDWAVRDYRTHLAAALKRSNATASWLRASSRRERRERSSRLSSTRGPKWWPTS
jgi:hypothetical protein